MDHFLSYSVLVRGTGGVGYWTATGGHQRSRPTSDGRTAISTYTPGGEGGTLNSLSRVITCRYGTGFNVIIVKNKCCSDSDTSIIPFFAICPQMAHLSESWRHWSRRTLAGRRLAVRVCARGHSRWGLSASSRSNSSSKYSRAHRS